MSETVISVVIAILAVVLQKEYHRWAPPLALLIVRFAAALSPIVEESQQARREWESDVNALSVGAGAVSALGHALRILVGVTPVFLLRILALIVRVLVIWLAVPVVMVGLLLTGVLVTLPAWILESIRREQPDYLPIGSRSRWLRAAQRLSLIPFLPPLTVVEFLMLSVKGLGCRVVAWIETLHESDWVFAQRGVNLMRDLNDTLMHAADFVRLLRTEMTAELRRVGSND